jgi:hypothetical protein
LFFISLGLWSDAQARLGAPDPFPKKPRAAGLGLVAERKPLAESIRQLRRELGLTQVALAEKIGAAATSIQLLKGDAITEIRHHPENRGRRPA